MAHICSLPGVKEESFSECEASFVESACASSGRGRSNSSTSSTSSSSSSSYSEGRYSVSVSGSDVSEDVEALVEGEMDAMAALLAGDIVSIEKVAHSEPISSIRWVPRRPESSESPSLLTVGMDQVVCLWQLARVTADGAVIVSLVGDDPVRKWKFVHRVSVLEAFDDSFVVGLASGELRRYPFTSPWPAVVYTSRKRTHVRAIRAVARMGEQLFSACDDGRVISWDWSRGTRIRRLDGHAMNVSTLVVSEGRLLSASWDRTILVFDAVTHKRLRELRGHTDSVKCLAVHRNLLVSGSRDTTVRAWTLHRCGRHMHTLRGHDAEVSAVAFPQQASPDVVLSSAHDGLVIIWSLWNGSMLSRLGAHEGPAVALRVATFFSFSGAVDGCIAVHSVATGEAIRSFEAHAGTVRDIAYQDGVLASGGRDGKVVFWIVESAPPGSVSFAALRAQMLAQLNVRLPKSSAAVSSAAVSTVPSSVPSSGQESEITSGVASWATSPRGGFTL